MMKKAYGYYSEPQRELKIIDHYDILVVGGGMSGCSAAVTAASLGARTLLIERYGFFGGTATAAMVGSICGLYTCGPDSTDQQLIFGRAQELINRLEKAGAGSKLKHRYHFDIPGMQLVLDRWLEEAGVELLLQTFVVDTIVFDNKVTGVIIENKGGRSVILADVIIDASGDGDVAARSGATFEIGDTEGHLQTPTYVFYLSGVDTNLAMSFPEKELKLLQEKSIESGEFPFKRTSGSFSPSPKPNNVHINMTRVPDINGIDPFSLTKGHILGRKQIDDYINFLKKYVPGFGNAYIDSIAAQLGIRETRRITGEYILQREDVLNAKKFPDAICRSSWPIEDHTYGQGTVRLHLSNDDYYHIPYRCLIPVKIDNLILAGRCISASHDAMASVRVMGPGLACGQAAGSAAVLSINNKQRPRDISMIELQESLKKQGVLL